MNETPPTRAHQPDDRLFKAVFRTPAHVEEVLLEFAPLQLLTALNLSTLRLTGDSFVDEQLAASMADIVMECESVMKKAVKVALILEHKSNVPDYPPFQIMHYQHQIWSAQVQSKDHKPSAP